MGTPSTALTSDISRGHLLLLEEGFAAEPLRDALCAHGFSVEWTTPQTWFERVQELQKADPQAPIWLHPGVGKLADQPKQVALAERENVRVLAPPLSVLSLFQNRLQLLLQAERLEIPILALSLDPLGSAREIAQAAAERGNPFPFVVRSAIRDEGHDSFTLKTPADVTNGGDALLRMIEGIRTRSGEVLLYLEALKEGSRRIQLPFWRWREGACSFADTVDVSLRWAHRDAVVISPTQNLEESLVRQLRSVTKRLLDQVHYVGAGFAEFCVDGDRFWLVDVTPRLSPYFSFYRDAVTAQISTWEDARAPLELLQSEPELPPAQMMCLIRGEDALRQLPRIGQGFRGRYESSLLSFSEVHWSREIPSRMQNREVAALWIRQENLELCFASARAAFRDLRIEGQIVTNESIIVQILDHPWVQVGAFHSTFLDEEFIPELGLRADLETALIAIALRLGKSGWRFNDQSLDLKKSPAVWIRDLSAAGSLGSAGTLTGKVAALNQALTVSVTPWGHSRWAVRVGFHTGILRQDTPAETRTDRKRELKLKSQVSGKVSALLHQTGSTVSEHEALVWVESVGELISHAVPIPVRIARWEVSPEQKVELGQTIAVMEPLDRSDSQT